MESLPSWANAAVNAVLFVFGAALSLILYLAFWQSPWLRYPSKEIPVLVSKVRPGESVPLYLRRINTDKEARTFQVVTLLVCDSFTKPLIVASKVQSVEAGDNEETRQSVPIPLTVPRDDGSEWPMPDGTCYFRGRSEIQGLIRTMTVEWRTKPFKVETGA